MIKLNPYEKTLLLLALLKVIKMKNLQYSSDDFFIDVMNVKHFNNKQLIALQERTSQIINTNKNNFELFLNSYLFENLEVHDYVFKDLEIMNNKITNYYKKLFDYKKNNSVFLKETGLDKYSKIFKYEILGEKENLIFSDLAEARKNVNFGFELTTNEIREFSYFIWKLFEKKERHNTLFENFKKTLIVMKEFYNDNNRMKRFIQTFYTDLFFNLDFGESSYKLMLPAKYHIDFSMINYSQYDMLSNIFLDIFLKEDPVSEKLKSIELIKLQ